MTEDTPVTDNATVADKPPENAAVSGSSALPQEELNRMTALHDAMGTTPNMPRRVAERLAAKA